MVRKYLSNRDRILLHLSAFPSSVNQYRAPFALTQDGIAQAIGIGRNNVPRELKTLIENGLVTSVKARVDGLKNRRSVYILTPVGRTAANDIREKIENVSVKVKDADGNESTILLRDISKKYGVDIIQAALNLTKTKEIDIINLLRKRGKRVHYIEENYIIKKFYGRKKELKSMIEWYHSDKKILFITGFSGIGKTTLTLKFLKDHLKDEDIFFIKINTYDTPLDVVNKLSRFLSRVGYPKLERYIRGRVNEREESVNWNAIYLILKESLNNGVFVFDNVEQATDSLKKFFERFIESAIQNKRVRLIFIGNGVGDFVPFNLINYMMELNIGELKKEEAYEMLIDGGLNENDAYKVIRKYGGNPLLLSLAKNQDDRIIRRFVLDVVIGNLNDKEKYALEFFSVFDKPVKISALLMNNIEYSTIYSLINKNIFQELEFEVLTLHKIIKNFVYERLTQQKKVEYHLMAAEYFMDEGEILQAIYHFLKGNKVLRASMLLYDYYENHLFTHHGVIRDLALKILDSYDGVDDHEWLLYGIIGDTYFVEGDWDSALNYYRKGEELAKRNDPDTWAKLRLKISEIMMKRDKYDESKSLLEEVFSEIGKISDRKIESKLNYLYGMIFLFKGETEIAENYLMIAFNKAEKLLDYKAMGNVMNSLGILYKRQGDYKMAIEYYMKAKEYFEVIDDKIGLAKVLNNMGSVYYVLYDKKAEEYLLQARRILEKSADEYTLSLNSLYLGTFYLWTEKWSSAEKYLKIAEKKFKDMYVKSNLANVYIALGDLYYYINRSDLSKKYFDKAIEIGMELGKEDIIRNAAKEVITTFKELEEKDMQKYKKMADGEVRFVSLVENQRSPRIR